MSMDILGRAEVLDGIALSPDGSKLAVAVNGRNRAFSSISVFSMATGKALRTWGQPGQERIGNESDFDSQPLTWTSDGQTIEFQQLAGDQAQTRLLDTTGPGSDLRSARLVLNFLVKPIGGAGVVYNGSAASTPSSRPTEPRSLAAPPGNTGTPPHR